MAVDINHGQSYIFAVDELSHGPIYLRRLF